MIVWITLHEGKMEIWFKIASSEIECQIEIEQTAERELTKNECLLKLQQNIAAWKAFAQSARLLNRAPHSSGRDHVVFTESSWSEIEFRIEFW